MENVRMGELKVSNRVGEQLGVIGIGSCIALALTDSEAQVAGMAHVVLPVSAGGPVEQPGKYADTAVPALLEAVLGLGARKRRINAVLIGGARMFATGMDIGSRNAEAVTEHLRGIGIPIRASDVGGTRGRSARLSIGGEVTSQMVGDTRTVLLSLGSVLAAA